MNTAPEDISVDDILQLKRQQMLVVNPEYQRGVVWTQSQKKKLVDSVLRGYPIPLIYLHHIRQAAGTLVSERYEVIDGQQRVNALSDFVDGAYKLFDPLKDQAEARFPDFIRKAPCPWAGKLFRELAPDLQSAFLGTTLRVVRIQTHDVNEARDLFVRLQAGMPLNSQEKRDAWPGQFTDFVLKLGGKPTLAKYPGHDFFNVLMRANKVSDRGKFRQLAAQIAMLLISREKSPTATFCDINAAAIDDFYYENLDFDSSGEYAQRINTALDTVTFLLRDGKRSKVLGHEAIHLALLVDSLLHGYVLDWRDRFASAFDQFREESAHAKATRNDPQPAPHWLRYGVLTRVNSDRGEGIQRRHEFFVSRMRAALQLRSKDPLRVFGPVEREIVYYRDKKRCAVCDAEVRWDESEIHHVEEHAKGGLTVLQNAALVHRDCHPKGAAAAAFASKWVPRAADGGREAGSESYLEDADDDEDEN